MRELVVCLVLVLSTPLTTSAQDSGPILPRGSEPGDRLMVTTAGGERVTGRLVSDGNGALVLFANERQRTIGHLEIDRVTQRHNRFLFGPLIGFGAGLATGLPAKKRFDNEGRDGNALVVWTIGVGVGLGSLIDLLNGSDRTVYARAPGRISDLHVRPTSRGAEVRWAIAW
jgi:hypothetical protein